MCSSVQPRIIAGNLLQSGTLLHAPEESLLRGLGDKVSWKGNWEQTGPCIHCPPLAGLGLIESMEVSNDKCLDRQISS